ncbi:MAG: hypothetical protein HRT87_01590 [Legionellales bacterium]|nr:hypothetical protein [Legionellales bacterium]
MSKNDYKIIEMAVLVDKNYPTGKTKHISLGEEVPAPYKLAIAKYENVDGFYLLYLDKNDVELTDTFHDSIEKAHEQARFEFNVENDQWNKFHDYKNMIIKCKNSRNLLISNQIFFNDSINNNLIPCVVLLPAWSNTNLHKSRNLKELIYYLLELGTSYFVCVGSCSKEMHDQIDEIAYQYDDEQNTSNSINIVTTHHFDVELEEAIDYFIYGTEIRNTQHGCLLALLNESEEERKIESFLKAHCKLD